MIFSTTPTLEGHPIREYRGVVTGETIIGANVFKDFMAGLRDFFGGRSGTYESVLREAKDSAMRGLVQNQVRQKIRAVNDAEDVTAVVVPVGLHQFSGHIRQLLAKTFAVNAIVFC